jgi:hypothetical protein
MTSLHDTPRCDVPITALAALVYGEPTPPNLPAHAAGCPSCSTRLATLREQREVLAHLAAPADPDARPPPWQPAAQLEGRRVAADLLAELARASLARSEPEARRAALNDLPRPLERIVADLRVLRARMESVDERLPLDALPDLEELGRRPEGTAELARACLDALERIEGRSARCDGLRARCV